MAKQKTKEGKLITINLDVKEVELMEFDQTIEGIKSRSEYIGFLIRLKSQATNPADHLKELQRQEEDLNKQLESIRIQRENAIKNIGLTKQIEKERLEKRPIAIQIIKRKYISEGIEVAQQIARNWAFKLNCNEAELLYEAIQGLKRENGREVTKKYQSKVCYEPGQRSKSC